MSKAASDMLADIGRALYGVHWRRPLADALGIEELQIDRWLAGEQPAQGAFGDALILLRRRETEITRTADALEEWMSRQRL